MCSFWEWSEAYEWQKVTSGQDGAKFWRILGDFIREELVVIFVALLSTPCNRSKALGPQSWKQQSRDSGEQS